jgi:hypothetical protein
MQALSMMQIRDLSERMTEEWRIGCPIRWRIEYMMASFSLNVAEGHGG